MATNYFSRRILLKQWMIFSTAFSSIIFPELLVKRKKESSLSTKEAEFYVDSRGGRMVG